MDFSVGYPGEEIGWVGWRLYKWMGEECDLVCCWGGKITKRCTYEILGMKYMENMERLFMEYLKQNRETIGP